MSSKADGTGTDLWSELIASEGGEFPQQPPLEEVYTRRRRRRQQPPQNTLHHDALTRLLGSNRRDLNRVSLAAADSKRISWNRSLSIRGRTSIAIQACVDHQLQQKQAKRKGKPAIPKGKFVQPTNYDRERMYFQEVDAFELLEESPSPKNFGTWAMGQFDIAAVPSLSYRLEQWLISKKNHSLAPSSTLSKILETPLVSIEPIGDSHLDNFNLRTPEKSARELDARLSSTQTRYTSSLIHDNVHEMDSNPENRSTKAEDVSTEDCESIEVSVKKLSLSSIPTSFHHDHQDPLNALLAVCGQSAPSTLKDVFSNYWFVP